jgi:hypothetical protein
MKQSWDKKNEKQFLTNDIEAEKLLLFLAVYNGLARIFPAIFCSYASKNQVKSATIATLFHMDSEKCHENILSYDHRCSGR